MARIYKLKVPNENMISRIISNDNLAHEIMVIDRTDKAFINTYLEKLEKPALYILVNRETDQLYIGETEDSIKRLRNHESKEFWTEAIVFHSKMNTLSTTEVKWLEAKTYEVVKELGYFDLSENKVKPTYPPLKEDQEIELIPVFEEAKRYICAAGFDIFLKRGKSNAWKEQGLFDNIESQDSNTAPVAPPAIKESAKSEVWLICYDKKYFDVAGCFKKCGQVYWTHKAGLQNVKKGDVAYLYSSSPESAIRYKVEIVDSQIPYSHEMDVEDEFAASGESNADGSKKKYFLVRPIAETHNPALSHAVMLQEGLMGKRPTVTRLSQKQYAKTLKYITENFGKQEAEVKAEEKCIVFTQKMKLAGGLCTMKFYPDSKRYVIGKGSNILSESSETCGKGAIALREKIKNDPQLSRCDGELYTILEDIELPTQLASPSGASKFCWGTSRPGPNDWEDENGVKYPSEWWKE